MRRAVSAILAALLFATWGPRAPLADEACLSVPQPPLTMGEVAFDSFHEYEDRKYGVSVKYASGPETLTLFAFDFGLTRIGERDYQSFFEAAVSDVYVFAERKGLALGKPRNLVDETMAGFGSFAYGAVTMSGGAPPSRTHDFVAMGYTPTCMTKVRYTLTGEHSLAQAEAKFLAHLKEMRAYFESTP